MRSGKTYIFWDTCVFIAWLNDEKQKWSPEVLRGIKDVADQVHANEVHLVVSTLMRTEIFIGQLDLETKQKFSGFLQRSNVHEIAPDMRITDRASSIREYYNRRSEKIKAPDAIMLATSILYRVDEMQTMDGLETNKRYTKLLALNGDVAGYPLVIVPPYPRGFTWTAPPTTLEIEAQTCMVFETQQTEEPATWADVYECLSLKWNR
jgi:hypothetical protein